VDKNLYIFYLLEEIWFCSFFCGGKHEEFTFGGQQGMNAVFGEHSLMMAVIN
jgi:hypothetical protein